MKKCVLIIFIFLVNILFSQDKLKKSNSISISSNINFYAQKNFNTKSIGFMLTEIDHQLDLRSHYTGIIAGNITIPSEIVVFDTLKLGYNNFNLNIGVFSKKFRKVHERINLKTELGFTTGSSFLKSNDIKSFNTFFSPHVCVYFGISIFKNLLIGFKLIYLYEISKFMWHYQKRPNNLNLPNFNQTGLGIGINLGFRKDKRN